MSRTMAVAMLVAAAIGCGDPPRPDAGTPPEPVVGGVTPAVVAMMDSAAEAYRAGDLSDAQRLYLGATVADTALAAPWFGLFMTRRALGLGPQADSALDRARWLASLHADRAAGARGRGN